MSKIKELLAVLDFTDERKQEKWLSSRVYYPPKDETDQRRWSDWWKETKANLAFQLRDELVGATPYSNRYAFGNALEMVYKHAEENGEEGTDKAGWGLYYSQPIHWIIAALIAKEKP